MSQAVQYFRYFDRDNSGSLDRAEFQEMWTDMARYGLADGPAPEAFQRIDNNGDGFVKFDEYLLFMGLMKP